MRAKVIILLKWFMSCHVMLSGTKTIFKLKLFFLLHEIKSTVQFHTHNGFKTGVSGVLNWLVLSCKCTALLVCVCGPLWNILMQWAQTRAWTHPSSREMPVDQRCHGNDRDAAGCPNDALLGVERASLNLFWSEGREESMNVTICVALCVWMYVCTKSTVD